MDIRQLEAFASTARHRSFSEAAKELYLSQPTVSAHIRALEQELHVRLINRTTNDITQIQMLVAMGLQILIKSPIMAV